MKYLLQPSRILVGLLFIFSGLIKANDPLGLSYKMQEFFELWGMSDFNSWTLILSVLVIAFEIIAGFALLLGWQMRLFIWLLFVLTLFFTFLTGYAYLSGKFKNCGCFGDCLPITPLTSFVKDLILLGLVLILFAGYKRIRPLFKALAMNILMLLVTVFAFGIQWYTLTYLPLVDCLPFKIGNNIPALQKIPANAIPDSTVITFVYNKQGQTVEYTAEELPADLNDSVYEFKSRYDKVVRKGSNNEPPIKGFALTGEGGTDSTTEVLRLSYAILLFCEDFTTDIEDWKTEFAELYRQAKQKNIPVFAVTGHRAEAMRLFANTEFKDIQIFNCDNTAIRTAARTNPCIYLLNKGTILNKQSHHRLSLISDQIDDIPEQAAPPPVFNSPVLETDSINP